MDTPTLILASASKGRLGLLESVDIIPDNIIPADIDETPLPKEKPHLFVKRLAQEKAHTVAATHKDSFIIAADTVGVCGTRILGKAANEEEAKAMLLLLSGKTHKVLTGVCVISPKGEERTKVIMTRVTFKRLDTKELEDYIASGQWKGKSGCYGIQTRGGGFIESINGSFSNVVGLPLVETKRLLYGLGFIQKG